MKIILTSVKRFWSEINQTLKISMFWKYEKMASKWGTTPLIVKKSAKIAAKLSKIATKTLLIAVCIRCNCTIVKNRRKIVEDCCKISENRSKIVEKRFRIVFFFNLYRRCVVVRHCSETTQTYIWKRCWLNDWTFWSHWNGTDLIQNERWKNPRNGTDLTLETAQI